MRAVAGVRGGGRAIRPGLLVFAAGLLVYVGWAVWQGQDSNWDLQNYHDYTAYALLHGRHLRDVGPGGFQSYFNPLIYLVPYGLRAALPPVAAAIALAALQAGVVAMAWLLSGLLPHRSMAVRAWATLCGATGAITLSEVGTSFADILLAIPVLGALALLVRADGARLGLVFSRPVFAAGLLVGAATGLKLTNALFAAGLGAAVLLPWPRRPVAAALAYGTGGLAGFALTGGAWAAMLAWKLGNPVFPTFNNLFQSPSAVFSAYGERSFLPAGVLDAISYPFRIAAGQHPSAETGFADPRLAIAAVLCPLWLIRGRDRAVVRSMVALWASAALWLGLFAVQRYIVVLEVLAGVLSVHLLAALAPRRYPPAVAAGAAAVVALALTRPADWWHRPWASAYVPRPPPALMEPATVLVASHPMGFWVSALPSASRFYAVTPTGLAAGGLLRERMAHGVHAPPGGRMWVMSADQALEQGPRDGLAAWGLAPAAPCHRAPSLWWVDTVFCRVAPGSNGIAALPLDTDVDFSRHGSGWVYEQSGWLNAGEEGLVNNGMGRLLLQPAHADGSLVLELAASGSDAMWVTVGDSAPIDWPALAGVAVRTVCVPAGGQAMRLGLEGRVMLRRLRLRAARPGEC